MGRSSSRVVQLAVERATAQASKSVETFRHGAVLLCGKKLVATGRNKNINACGLSSIHAEMDATWKAKTVMGTHIVVVRLRRDQLFGYSRPCAACVRALAQSGVRRMTYTTGDPEQPLATECLTRLPL